MICDICLKETKNKDLICDDCNLKEKIPLFLDPKSNIYTPIIIHENNDK